jgi:hypothetical protein
VSTHRTAHEVRTDHRSAGNVRDFHTFNLNFMIRELNKLGHHILLEDSTVAYLIKRARKFPGEGNEDPEWEKLVELWEYNLKEKIIF